MKLAYLTTLYPDYLARLYERHPGLALGSWEEQRAALDRDAFGWIGVWPRALAPLGYQVLEVPLNAAALQRAWRAAHGAGAVAAGSSLEDIALAQIQDFAPDVLWYDHDDDALLQRLRATVPAIRQVLGWTGSWVPEGRTWRGTDLILSCAPESVEALRRRGLRTGLLSHGFDQRVLSDLAERPPSYDVTFIGQITRGHPLHVHRERLLDRLRREVDLAIFSPSAGAGFWYAPRAHARRVLYGSVRALRRVGVSTAMLRGIPALRQAATWPNPPRAPLSAGLRRALRPARYGIEMYQTLRDSRIVLNIESGSTTRHSSNMRLFEATGVGACLLTDWTEGLTEQFEPGREVATFTSPEECVRCIRELLAAPGQREAIARAGQARTLRDHTYRRRALVLDALLRGAAGADPVPPAAAASQA